MQPEPVRLNSDANGELSDAIQCFLASPPKGTPIELLELFNAVDGRNYLPPKIFLEAVEQAPIAISITDRSATILYVNKAFEQLTGYKRSEVTGKNESVLSSRSTPSSIYKTLWKTIQNKQVWKGKLVNHSKAKQEYLAELVISPVLDQHNEIRYFLGMHRDITSMHQLEQRFTFQKQLTESALDAIPMVVAMVDMEGKVLLDNLAYKALQGDFRGVEPSDLLINAIEQQMNYDQGVLCREGTRFYNIEVRLDPPSNGSPRWFSCSGVRVEELDEAAHTYFNPSNNRCCLVLIANEITESRKRFHEARINMLRSNMAEQQIVQTMREAISAAMYKLRAPLNVIKAALSMMEANNQENHLQTILKQALDSGDEAMDSLQDALPTPATEQQTNINLNEVIHDVITLSTERLLSAGIVVDWRPATVLPTVLGRSNALRGVFKYLIDNAIQAVNETRQDAREIRIQTRVEASDLIVEVMDNGSGVPEHERIKVFEPFYCGWNNPRERSGMGLTMAQEVALSHGGSVEINPDFLGGCCVLVRLPFNNDDRD